MMQTLTERTPSLRALDPRVSAQVLRSAIEARAPVWLRAGADDDGPAWSGFLAGMDSSSLTMEIYNLDSGARGILACATLRASAALADTRYSFDTRCAGDIPSTQTGAIRVSRPLRVFLVERRSSPRRSFREAGQVTLCTFAPRDPWQCSGAMLNLSPDGIACRVGRKDAEPIRIGQVLRVDFRVDLKSEALALAGRVVSLTPGGTADHVVVGAEFVDEGDLSASRALLRAALEKMYQAPSSGST